MRAGLSALLNESKLLTSTLLNLQRRRTIYVGYLGRWNFGDELLHDIYRRVSGHRTLPVLDHFSLQPQLNAPCVLGGGTVIGGPIYLRAIQRLRLRPARVFCAGVIPGAIDSEWAKVLSGASVYTRSEESRERLAPLGINAMALVDPAVFASQIYSLVAWPAESRRSIIFAMHGSYAHADYYGAMIGRLNAGEKKNLVFFASSPADLTLCRAMRHRYGGKIMVGWRRLRAAVEAIAEARFVVSTRLHPAICAASAGTPFRMLAYERKHTEFAVSIDAETALADPSGDPIQIVEEMRQAKPGILPGVQQWQGRNDDFRDLFARPI
jgi:Polysaccharide pyruvyl transferase